MIRLSEEDKFWLRKNFPGLCIKLNKNKFYYIEGSLEINACYNPKSKEFIIFPNESQKEHGKYIYDHYSVKIINEDGSFISKVYELDGRLQNVASMKNMPIHDLHVNPSGNVCLCPRTLEKIKLPRKYSFNNFICELIIPFFYFQSFFEKYNYWPWNAYSHGDMGILETYFKFAPSQKNNPEFLLDTFNSLQPEIKALIKDKSVKITRQALCLCGTKQKFRSCHHKAWKGLKQLKIDFA